MTSSPRAAPPDRTPLRLMLALTFGTGIADAVGYLGLDLVFTGNMTGNVLILGMALAGGADLPVLGPLLALLGFLAGATLSGRVLRHVAGAWTGRTTVLFGLVGVVLMALAVLLLVAGEDPPRPIALTASTVLATAMGVQAGTARFIAVPDVTTVVITSTLTGLGADSVLGRGQGAHRGRRVAAVLLLLTGAATGAVLVRWHVGAGPVLAGAIAFSVMVVGARHGRSEPPAPPSGPPPGH